MDRTTKGVMIFLLCVLLFFCLKLYFKSGPGLEPTKRIFSDFFGVDESEYDEYGGGEDTFYELHDPLKAIEEHISSGLEYNGVQFDEED